MEALIALLSDIDDDIFQHVKAEIKAHYLQAIPYLETAVAQTQNSLLQERAQKLLKKLYTKRTLYELNVWKEGKTQNLIEASLILSRFLYPKLNEQKLKNQIEELVKDAWLEMSEEFTDLEKIHILNHVFFKIYRFNNDRKNWFLPQNNELNHLLNNRSGNAVILSILYLEVAQKLNLPVFPINLPENFILSYLNPKELKQSGEALFYINPINGGNIFNKSEIDDFLKNNHLPQERYYYEPCDNATVIKRLIVEYIASYESSGDTEKSKNFKKFLKAL